MTTVAIEPGSVRAFSVVPDPAVAFTGSTAVGRRLTGLASDHMTPVLMELGGHAPVIVCEDTDVRAAAVSSAVRKMRNAGQVCTSPTRFFVHDSICEEFLSEHDETVYRYYKTISQKVDIAIAL